MKLILRSFRPNHRFFYFSNVFKDVEKNIGLYKHVRLIFPLTTIINE